VVDTTGPSFTSSDSVEVVINSAIATVIYTAVATDTNTVTYHLKTGDDATKFNLTNNGELKYNNIQTLVEDHTVTIIATDVAGNTSEQAVTVSVKATLINTSVAWNNIGNDNIANATEITTATLSGTAVIANVTGVTISSIVFTEVDNTNNKVTIDGNDVPTIDTSNNTWTLANGKFASQLTNNKSYTVEVTLSGTASSGTVTNISTYAGSVLVDKTPAAAPTDLTLLASDNIDHNNTTNKATVTITGKAEAGAIVELFNNATSLGTKTADSDGNFSKSVTLPENTTTNITAKATDIAGNTTSSASTPLSVTVDTIKPVIGDVTFSWGNDYLSKSESEAESTITVAITDTNLSNQEVTLTIGTGTSPLTYKTIFPADNAVFTIPANALKTLNGNIAYTINVSDRVGNAAIEKTGSFIIDITAPTITGTLFDNTGITITDASGLGGLTANFTVSNTITSTFSLTTTSNITLSLDGTTLSYKGTVITTAATDLRTPAINPSFTFTNTASTEAVHAIINAISYTGLKQDITLTLKDRDNNTSTATLPAANVPNTASLIYTTSNFTETDANTGEITGTMFLTLKNDTFVNATLTEGTDYTTTNIPTGLTMLITLNSTNTATISFTGNATNHLKTHDLTNIGITFKKEAFTTQTLPQSHSKTDIPLSFIEAGAPTITESTTGTSLIGKSIIITDTDGYTGLVINANTPDNTKTSFAIDITPTEITYNTATKTISYSGTQVATVALDNGLTITFNNNATQPAVNAITSAITATHANGAQPITLTATDAQSQSIHFIQGTAGNDVINGSDENDIIKGGMGHDTLKGGKGNDTLIGGVGRDNLIGGEGNDLLIGGIGDDYLTGGAGNDIFKFNSLDDSPKNRFATIYDFSITEDKIDLSILLQDQVITASNLSHYVFTDTHTYNANGVTKYRNIINIDVDGQMNDGIANADMEIAIGTGPDYLFDTQSEANALTAQLNNGNLSEYILR
ncbi:MAG: type I secretion C-terminal target domain-containing protein, partial [Gammaproteobacteria bacterium]|nr:type I secretion C-terminal target domain-containing protein [Gammaproteobacteria bacterium]